LSYLQFKLLLLESSEKPFLWKRKEMRQVVENAVQIAPKIVHVALGGR
jgi:hypothetical protein